METTAVFRTAILNKKDCEEVTYFLLGRQKKTKKTTIGESDKNSWTQIYMLSLLFLEETQVKLIYDGYLK